MVMGIKEYFDLQEEIPFNSGSRPASYFIIDALAIDRFIGDIKLPSLEAPGPRQAQEYPTFAFKYRTSNHSRRSFAESITRRNTNAEFVLIVKDIASI